MSSFDCSHHPEISRSINLALYSRSALAETQAAFRQFCQVQTKPLDQGRFLVTISPLISDTQDVKKMILEFWNYFLDKTCQEKLG